MTLPRLAVVGVGHMGNYHAQKLHQLTAEGLADFVGVYDPDAERAAEVAAPLGVTAFPDLEALCEATDAACLAAPTSEHGRLGERLLSNGVDLLIEKPIAATREEAQRLVEVAARYGRILQVGHIERFSSAIRAILPVLKRPRFIEVHRIGPFPARATDVSVVLDLMIHDLDIVSLIAGSKVDRVEAIGVPVLSQTEDIANARVRFGNGCILNLTASRVSLEKMRKIRVFQADAYVSIDLATQKITIVRREGDPSKGETPRIEVENLEFDGEDALLAQDRAFVEAVTLRSTPVVTGEDGCRALDLALLIQESIPPLEELA